MIIGEEPFNPGQMQTLVNLNQRSVTTTAGFQVPGVGSAIASNVWARWKNSHGSEAWTITLTLAAAQLATIIIRYVAGLDNTCLVVRGSEVWEIVSMDDINDLHEFIEINLKRLTSG